MKRLLFVVLFLFFIILTPKVFAQSNQFVTIVNPIRGSDFWAIKDQKPETAVVGQSAILDKFNLPASWLLRFDALQDKTITDRLRGRVSDEKGLFLEVTPTWTDQAKVDYHKSNSWHAAGSAFLTGYERGEREQLIDTAFEKFKSTFGYYPVSVGAWWIDSYSLGYMQKKYGIIAALIVADQYSTDNYQIWGQYFGTPYYPTKNNALRPAQTIENKLPIVIMQWASRDPVNAYGNGVSESTFSVQANDYLDYHNLDTNYFSRLIDVYTNQTFNQFAQVVVGLENSYEWNRYADEYKNQIKILSEKRNSRQFSIIPMNDFANWYKSTFPTLSPPQIIVVDDPLGSFKKAVWFMDPYYRAAWFVNSEGSVFRDIRQYVDGEEELCFKNRCDSVNFATFATRVLDNVTYGNKWIIDEGKIKDFNVLKESDGYLINYINEAGHKRRIEFLPRDIKVDDKISTIDGAILNVIKQDKTAQQKNNRFNNGLFHWSISSILFKLTIFSLFIIVTCLIPGLVLTNKLYEVETFLLLKMFVSLVVGFVSLTIIFYIASLLNLRLLSLVYILGSLLLFFKSKLLTTLKLNIKGLDKLSLISLLIIISGTIFQSIPVFKSGLTFPYGLGFWGPNTHDGVWHISLINQLFKGIPVENPIFANTNLHNYHFFYDLLVAATVFFTKIPILDLVFRFYPVLFSLLLGAGTYYLVMSLFRNKIAAIFSLYFVYFAGSFGWIVEYLRQKTFGGESAFWANQSISFNLNPPFAVSLLIIIALLHLLLNSKNKNLYWMSVIAILAGSLVGFKAYAAVLILVSLLLISIINLFKKDFSYLLILVFSSIITLLIFFSNFESSQQLVLFSPFWFIHSMIDSPDRVGWIRLSLAREAGFVKNNWLKFITAEILSLLIFIIGNLGLRIISLASLIKIKSILKNEKYLFILIFTFLSFLIPILFIQSGNPWNTIQFSYYGLYIAAIVSGVVLSRYLSKPIILVLFILVPINSITTASYYLGRPHAIINSKELEGLEFLSRQPNGTVLTYPYDEKIKQRLAEPWPLFVYDSTAYVSAFSKKSVFLEDEAQNVILLTDYKKRLVASKDFFLKPITASINFLYDNHIKYIYLPKYFNIFIEESSLNLKTIFENEEVKIYQRI